MLDPMYETRAMFNDSWSPLFGEIPEHFTCFDLTKQAIQIIEKSRNICKFCPRDDTSKSELLRKIWTDIRRFSSKLSGSILDPRMVDPNNIPKECQKIALSVRRRYAPEIEQIGDYEIAALFAIAWAIRPLTAWQQINKSGLDMEKNLMFLENDISVAEAALGWAEQLQPKNQGDNLDSISQVERNVFCMCGDNFKIKFGSGEPIYMDDLVGWCYMRHVMRHIREHIQVISLQQIAGKNTRFEQDRQRLIKKSKFVEHDDESTSKAKKRSAKKPQNYLGDIFDLVEDLEIMGFVAAEKTECEEIIKLGHTEEVTKRLEKIKEIIKTATGSTGKALDHHIDVITKIMELRKKKELMEEDGKQEDVNKIQDEIEYLKSQLSDSLMKGSSKIKIKSNFKNTYNAISKAIKEAREKIREKHPELYDHLNKYIKYKEGKYVYEPTEDPQWLFD